MIKNNKLLLFITSLIILAPILFGIAVWDELPEVIATHWGINNQPDGYSSRFMVVYGMPLLMLAIHIFCIIAMELDIKKRNHTPAVRSLVLFVAPVTSVFAMTMIYAGALGLKLDVGLWAMLFCGLLFIIIGNYMPKCRQNWTMGIRNRWTLSDPENWNHTHRLAGPIWMLGGVIMLLCGFFSDLTVVPYLFVVIVLAMVLVPTVYSYLYYKQHIKEE